MIKKLHFITKDLIERAAQKINENSVPPRRAAKDYVVVVRE